MMWIDLETRSQVDLFAYGLPRYAQDLTTEVICASYCFGDGEVSTWFAEDGPFPQEIIDYIATGGICYAQNATFERYMFDYVLSNDYNFTAPALTQWRCSAARAMAHGLPASLKDICRALDLPLQKQESGTRLITWYCKPNFYTEWIKDDKALMQEYCEVDTLAMRQFCSILRELTDEEWEQYHITEIMNDRGVPLDIPFATAALDYADEVKADVDGRIAEFTEGAVPDSRARTKRDKWLFPQLTDEQLKLLEVKKKGVTKYSMDAEHRTNLSLAEDLPPKVAKFVELLEEAGGSAVAKYKSMVNMHVDGRYQGAMIWNGAGQTGRYSSRGLQLQNFKRDVFKDPEPIIKDIVEGYHLDNPSSALGRLVRSAIYHPEGVTFSDYAQIEARVLPWLSDSVDGEKTLDVFRNGRDIYTENAVGMFSLKNEDEVDSDIRQSAKQGVLACGFGGGAGAVQAMAKGYGLIFSKDKCELIKTKWRAANPWAEPFWYGLKDAAQQAVRHPNTTTTHARLSFHFDGYWLWMMLPSGRCLAYGDVKFEMVEYPWGDEGLELTCIWGGGKPKAGGKWLRRTINHLILSENATQGCAADLMREAIVRAHKQGLPILFSVHDELVVQGHCNGPLTETMESAPPWATGLPIKADTKESYRYGK